MFSDSVLLSNESSATQDRNKFKLIVTTFDNQTSLAFLVAIVVHTIDLIGFNKCNPFTFFVPI